MAWWSLGVRTENAKLVEFVEREVEMIVQVRTSKLSCGLVKAEVSLATREVETGPKFIR